MIKHTLSVAWKEIQLIARDRGSLVILFLLPLLFGTLYGSINLQFAGGGDTPAVLVDVSLVNQDAGTFGEQIALALNEISVLNVETLDPASVDVTAVAEQRVAEGHVSAAIVIPANFSADVEAYTPATIDVIVDPAQPESASIVGGIMNKVIDEATVWGEVLYGIRTLLDESGVLEDASPETQMAIQAQNLGVIMTRINEMRRAPRLTVVTEDLQGARIEGGIELFFALLFPGITVMFVFFGVGMSGASLLTERETGALRRLLAAPIPRGSIIGGKMLGYMVLVCLQVVVLFGVGRAFFGMPLGEAPLTLALLTLLLAFVATAMGMMIAALARSPKQADSIGTVLGFVLGGLGGCVALSPTPLTRTGGFMSVIARLTPHGHAVDAYYSLMAEKAGFLDVLPELSILLAIGIAFFLIATWRFRFTD